MKIMILGDSNNKEMIEKQKEIIAIDAIDKNSETFELKECLKQNGYSEHSIGLEFELKRFDMEELDEEWRKRQKPKESLKKRNSNPFTPNQYKSNNPFRNTKKGRKW